MNTLGCYKCRNNAELPQFGTVGAACFDIKTYLKWGDKVKIYSYFNNEVLCPVREDNKLIIKPGDRALIPTGLIFDIPEGFSLRLHIRSSVALKLGLSLANCEAVIDHDYYHETFILLINNSEKPVIISDGDRIAQAELVKSVPTEIVELNDSPIQKTDRVGGFGSTGK